MTTRQTLAATAIAAGLALSAIAPAAAQFSVPLSPESQRFVTVARTGANFIDEASRTALANGAGRAAQSFARAAIADQDAVTDKMKNLADIVLPQTGRSTVVPGNASPFDALFGAFDFAATADASVGGTPLATTPAGLPITAAQQETLDKLQSLNGRVFDRAYIASQRAAYDALYAAYDDYSRTGDDSALRDAAAQQLPAIQRQRDRLKKL